VLVGLAFMFAVNFIRFGSPFVSGYQAAFDGALLVGLIFELASPGRGLLWYFPLALLAPIGAWVLWRRGLRHETAALILPVLIYLPLYAEWPFNGWSYGPRYLVPLIPLLGLLAGSVAWSHRRYGPVVLFGALAIGGGLANVGHLAVDPLRAFWGVYGASDYGTPGFSRQFDIGALFPVGAWQMYDPVAGPDVMWLRLIGSTHGLSIVVFLFLLLLGFLALVRAWILSGRMSSATRAGGS